MLKILYLNVDIFREERLFEKGMGLISPERKQKIEAFRASASALLSLGAGVLLHLALEQKGLSHRQKDIRIGRFGKPYLEGGDFYFSLSHSGDYAVCAYGDVPVGVDLQKVKEKLPSHTSKILSAEESCYLEGLEEEEKREAFFRLWARKEAVSKWDGRGLRLPLQELSFVKEDKLSEQIFLEEKRLFLQGTDILMPAYALYVCSGKEEGGAVETEEITTEILTNY